MYAFAIRGALCASVLLVVSVSSARAQGPTPATSVAVARVLAERATLQTRLDGAHGTLAAHKEEEESQSVLTTSTAALKAAVARLPTLRPGTTRDFLARQLQFPRVRSAYHTRAKRVSMLFGDLGISTPEVFFRVFKKEQVLEIWARDRGTGRFELLSTYPVCKLSGRLGPKRRQGDLQIPEGFYQIDLLNPQSSYHLSMHVDYPNPVDRARGTGAPLGGDIYIHGGCATIGCVPVTDQWIEEIYLIAIEAHDAGQSSIPVHIFPTRLDTRGLTWLTATYGGEFIDLPFWRNLQEGYLAFERTRTVPLVGYDGARYTFPAAAPVAAPADAIATTGSPGS